MNIYDSNLKKDVHMNNSSLFKIFFLFSLLLFPLVHCDKGQYSPYPLPDDPEEWVCRDAHPTQDQLKELCDQPRGTPASVGVPSDLFNLNQKNAFDKKYKKFLNDLQYRKNGWLHDQSWRLSGPLAYGANNTDINNYGVHPAVRIHYSPEAVEWLCNGRPDGGMPDGAMIIKEMVEIDSSIIKGTDSENCISLNNDVLNENFNKSKQWTIMIKNSKASTDGWYFGWYGDESRKGNPPIVNKSAFTSKIHPTNPKAQNTGGSDSIVFPNSMYGNGGCLNCHGSAEKESTFITLDNIITEGWKYKWYYQDQAAPSYSPSYPEYPKALKKPDSTFLSTFSLLGPVSNSQAWNLRLPAETFDHNVMPPGDGPQFLTSDQCSGCHDASIANSWLPNMMWQDDKGYRVNLSMYGEWKSSPMGLAGRDPIFFSQLQSEGNQLPASLTQCLENTCLKCHGMMGQRQFSADTSDTPDAAACNEVIYPVQPPSEIPVGKLYDLSYVTKYQNKRGDHNAKYGALSRDGISCMSCHQMEVEEPKWPEVNEHTFTGNFLTAKKNLIYGPFNDVKTKPMEHIVNHKPEYGKQLLSSQMCGNCHNIILPVIDTQGHVYNGTKQDGKFYPNKAGYEQSTELEWQNSVYSKYNSSSYKSCQDCHMGHEYNGEKLKFRIANNQDATFPPTTESLPVSELENKTRDNYRRHQLHGLNVFLNQMFQQFPLLLGFRQIDYETGANVQPSLITSQYSMNDMAQNSTATISVHPYSITEEGGVSTLSAKVKVTNKAGHYFPSGVGFRRAFIEFKVVDTEGNLIWASGRTNSLGQILDGTTNKVLPAENPVANPTTWQPHYQNITSGNQVQIYQEVILDQYKHVTTSFIRRFHHVKDNRLRPKGYDPKVFTSNSSRYIQELGELHGTGNDPYYSDPSKTGADELEYKITIPKDKVQKVAYVEATLYYQSIPPGYLMERFRDANVGPKNQNEIRRLYYITSNMDVNSPEDHKGDAYMKDWKIQISTSRQSN